MSPSSVIQLVVLDSGEVESKVLKEEEEEGKKGEKKKKKKLMINTIYKFIQLQNSGKTEPLGIWYLVKMANGMHMLS